MDYKIMIGFKAECDDDQIDDFTRIFVNNLKEMGKNFLEDGILVYGIETESIDYLEDLWL